MKSFIKSIFTWDVISTVIIALLLGMLLGFVYHSEFCIGLRAKFHDLYLKFNPDIQKDSHTLIMDRVTKDTPNLPTTDIFEEPKQKENNFILFIKKIFINKKETEPDIHNFVLN